MLKKRTQCMCLNFLGLLCYPLVINCKYTGKMPLQHDGYSTAIMSMPNRSTNFPCVWLVNFLCQCVRDTCRDYNCQYCMTLLLPVSICDFFIEGKLVTRQQRKTHIMDGSIHNWLVLDETPLPLTKFDLTYMMAFIRTSNYHIFQRRKYRFIIIILK